MWVSKFSFITVDLEVVTGSDNDYDDAGGLVLVHSSVLDALQELKDALPSVSRFRRFLDPDIGFGTPEETRALSEYLGRVDALVHTIDQAEAGPPQVSPETAALQVLVDFCCEHFRPYSQVEMSRSWGGRGYSLEDRLDHVLRFAQMAGADIPDGVLLTAPWDGDAEVISMFSPDAETPVVTPKTHKS